MADERWQSIESAPKDGTWIIVGNANGALIACWGSTPFVSGWYDGRWYSVNMTHWMPRPDPPDAEGQVNG